MEGEGGAGGDGLESDVTRIVAERISHLAKAKRDLHPDQGTPPGGYEYCDHVYSAVPRLVPFNRILGHIAAHVSSQAD